MLPEPPFEHILRLTDERGIFEHADGIAPRHECGYCLDDVARALIVVPAIRAATPVGGWGPGGPGPAFDQQPIEGAALADACLRAFRLTGDHRWTDGLDRSTLAMVSTLQHAADRSSHTRLMSVGS